jgi:FG-GAP repeat
VRGNWLRWRGTSVYQEKVSMRFRYFNSATAFTLVRRAAGSLGLAGLALAAPWSAAALTGRAPALQRPGPSWSALRDRVRAGLLGNETGFSVAISGSIAVISAPGADKNSGAAYIYTRTGGGWRQEATLPDPEGSAEDNNFAWAVAVSSTKAGTYVAIGGHSNKAGTRSFVYIYKNAGTRWQLATKVGSPSRAAVLGYFGSSLTISASTLVVGAPYANSLSGISYIYEHEGPAWILKAINPDPLDRDGDYFSQSVGVSGSNVIVGGSDYAYVYTHQPGHGWSNAVLLHNPDTSGNFFGQSVAITAGMAMVGAPNFSPSRTQTFSPTGAVYVYKKAGKSWKLYQELTAPSAVQGNQFGNSVAVSGKSMLIGMPTYGDPNCGTAFLFDLSGGEWREQRQITDPKCTTGDEFGYSAAVSGASGVLGAPLTKDGSGAFYFQSLS